MKVEKRANSLVELLVIQKAAWSVGDSDDQLALTMAAGMVVRWETLSFVM
jgi:hypothetical protein